MDLLSPVKETLNGPSINLLAGTHISTRNFWATGVLCTISPVRPSFGSSSAACEFSYLPLRTYAERTRNKYLCVHFHIYGSDGIYVPMRLIRSSTYHNADRASRMLFTTVMHSFLNQR
ncbi:hypothetical protein Tsp_04825 [Trichinella spiralis]|uniref:hypothetical protein n=1 Tax=Trichinella spiralis TaxID=6334 RepID=UPI0001EFDFDE|nr:hypothetical protein Tsp_04825 [Trichinella spiralis]